MLVVDCSIQKLQLSILICEVLKKLSPPSSCKTKLFGVTYMNCTPSVRLYHKQSSNKLITHNFYYKRFL